MKWYNTHSGTHTATRATMCWCVCFCSWVNLYRDAEKIYTFHGHGACNRKKHQARDRRQNQIDLYCGNVSRIHRNWMFCLRRVKRWRDWEWEGASKNQSSIEIMIYFMNFNSFKLLYYARLQIIVCSAIVKIGLRTGSILSCFVHLLFVRLLWYCCCYYFKLYLYGNKNRARFGF